MQWWSESLLDVPKWKLTLGVDQNRAWPMSFLTVPPSHKRPPTLFKGLFSRVERSQRTGGNAQCQSLKPQFVFSRWFSKPKISILFLKSLKDLHFHLDTRKLPGISLSAYQQVIISEIAFISRASIKHAAAANFPSRVWPAGDLLMNRPSFSGPFNQNVPILTALQKFTIFSMSIM